MYKRQDKHLLSRSRSIVCLTVSDQGSGMDDETKKHIFNRFYRGDSARSHKQNYGLGLSIAKELVQLHKGTISVSDSPDAVSYTHLDVYKRQLPVLCREPHPAFQTLYSPV